MKKTLTLQHTNERSLELRSKREISFVVAEGEASIDDIVQAQHVLLSERNIPQWIAEIHQVHVQPGDYPKKITLGLSHTVALYDAWVEVSKVIQGKSLNHAKIELLNVDRLIEVGTPIASGTHEPFEPLTANQAADRLAWTYGVEREQVQISIQL